MDRKYVALTLDLRKLAPLFKHTLSKSWVRKTIPYHTIYAVVYFSVLYREKGVVISGTIP